MPRSDDASTESLPADEAPAPPLRAHESAPGKIVLVEPDNSDGWISTDDAVDVEQHR